MEIKTKEEIEKIIKAQEITDKAYEHILGFIKKGMTEKQVADELERKMFELGAEGLAFPTIAVAGVNSAIPHGEPSDKKLEAGEFFKMDFGAMYQGYCSDMTRTVAIEYLKESHAKIYYTVLKAQELAISSIKPGIVCKDVDKTARDYITSQGYGEYFIHGLGHGVGTEVHETPAFNTRCEDLTRPNMVMTVEPGIYIPDIGGVRIEDMVIITEDGCQNITKSTKKLIFIK